MAESSWRRRRRGGAAIEFALVAPVLLVIFGAIVELSLYVNAFHRVSRAARDAARVGSTVIEGQNPDGTKIVAQAEAHGAFVLEQAGMACSTDCSIAAVWELDEDEDWYYITVTVTYPYEGLTGVMSGLEFTGVVSQFTMMTQQQ